MARVRVNQSSSAVPVADAHRALQLAQVLEEAPEHFEHRLAVGEEHVAPHHRIARGNARKIAEAGGRELDHLGLRVRLEVGDRAHDVVGDEMRHVAGDREHHVVVLGVHHLDIGAERPPEAAQPLDRHRIDMRLRREHAPAVGEELGKARGRPRMLGARDRMRRDEMHVLRQQRRHAR